MCHAAKYIPGTLSRAPASETHHREMLSKPFWYWTENLPLLSSSRVWMSPSSPIPGNSLFTPAYYNTACLIMSSLSPWGHPDISSLEAHITVRGRRLKKNKFKEHPEDLVVWSALLSLSVFWPPFRSGLVCWAATRPPGSTACSRFPQQIRVHLGLGFLQDWKRVSQDHSDPGLPLSPTCLERT